MSAQRTEKPTPRRVKKAREEGRFLTSRELTSSVQFVAFLVLLGVFGATLFEALRKLTASFLRMAVGFECTPGSLTALSTELFRSFGLPLMLGGSCLTLAAAAAQASTTKLGISTHKLVPNLARLNPIQKLRELPKQNLPAFLQSAALVPLFGYALYALMRSWLPRVGTLTLAPVEISLRIVAAEAKDLLWRGAYVLIALACLDFWRHKRRYDSELKMTKQEVREEIKESDANPQMKARIRRIQRDTARRSMFKNVPQATAIIVNPTHYAVAIRYEMDSMSAPKLVAKGKNLIARRIRQIASEHQVPIVENKPLAQALYRSVDVGQEIPAHLYKAVAEILAYLFKIMRTQQKGFRPRP